MYTADLLKVTTYGDNGAEVPRFTNFRAVIPMADCRRYVTSGAEVSVRIEAEDAETFWDECRASNLWEALLPGVNVDSDPADLFAAAIKALADEGFRVNGIVWDASQLRYSRGIEVAS